jgi:acyl-CoA reductase-like NAD-dependent aldehyde dehydrogenase
VKLVREAGMPDGWVQTLIPESRGLSEAFATDVRVAFLSFIGSAQVGWRLRSILAPGTRCALEHGGVAPVIVDRSADLDAIIEPIAKGGYYLAGQVCVSVQRIYVHAELKRAFIDRLAARVEQLRVGDPTRADTEVGPLITPTEADRVETWIEEAVTGGARRIGGGRLSETTLKPAILVDPPRDAKVSSHEIFGPVTCVYGFDGVRPYQDAEQQAALTVHRTRDLLISQRTLLTRSAAKRADAQPVGPLNDLAIVVPIWLASSDSQLPGRAGGRPHPLSVMMAAASYVSTGLWGATF